MPSKSDAIILDSLCVTISGETVIQQLVCWYVVGQSDASCMVPGLKRPGAVRLAGFVDRFGL
jgi:hypothetical protein